ncbi:MAG: hypothetical protein HCA25_02555 [Dolichospermum sp. DET50]|nr:hypothetical protein [Dolichospermum sp. DET66]MBS3031188.1 hypothetical protein [Dolichospermum sp. DET67]MBS3036398.1 hypothetical protein [Dolichospermum sp. DET50]QSX68456.1 MAG: hypothetical protein EZY12_01725 [Dolichospermum sp. DET69]
MAITIEKTLLNNQSILQNIALVQEIDEQAAEIISGGQSNKEISVFDGEDDPIVENTNKANLGFGTQRRSRRRDGYRDRNRHHCD